MQSVASRKSVRGAFRPNASLYRSRKLSFEPPQNKMQAFQLDKCLEKKNLDKVIYQLQSSADTAAKNRPIVTKGRDSSAGKSYMFNVDGFAEFLSTQKALGVLLFWKDAEDYRMIFGNEELKGAAKKIHQRYLKQGAEYEVSTIQAAMRTKIEGRLSNPPVDIFEELQMEMYQVSVPQRARVRVDVRAGGYP